jgi:hypothetical protein
MAATLALCGALLVATALPAPAGASTAASTRPSARTLATEICEDMVRNALESSLGAPLPGVQQGAWTGTTYTCSYPLPGGQIVLRVDNLQTRTKAQSAYNRLAKAAVGHTRLNGLGDRAYQSRDGTLVASKDQFVLHIDPSAVPPPTSKSDLAFAAVVAVLSCWSGTGT